MIALTAYKDKKVGVFGLGKAGQAAIAAFRAGGAQVFAWDDKEVASGKWQVAGSDNTCHLPLATCHYTDWPWHELSTLALSPGVPLTHPVVVRARAVGCPIKGDVELLYEACPQALTIGITGTNGKSTTTALIGHILTECGYEVQVGGNLGTPALALEPLGEDGIYVLEMSSYQLELITHTRFDIAVLLNFTPDHLDRHGDMDGYVRAKQRIFMNHDQPPADEWERGVAIIAVDDDYTRAVADAVTRNPHLDVLRVSVRDALATGVYVTDGMLYDHIPEAVAPAMPSEPLDLRAMPTLPGRHNWQNAASAYAAARICGVTLSEAAAAMQTFPGLRHRLQLVATIRGVRFLNDSKATNADATANALAPYENIYWIAGGKPKAGGIDSLAPFFPNIAHAFLIGEAEDAFARTLEGKVSYSRCGTLEAAVQQAAEMAFAEKKSGALVLLSPACASFDQFNSFEQRGDVFCALVSHIPSET